jgi:hypothetical protein
MSELTLPVDIKSPSGNVVARLEMGAAEGSEYVTLRIFDGDIINVRNVQGGTTDNPNLDLGAGDSGAHRGSVVVNWDVGNEFAVFNGRKVRAFDVNRDNKGIINSRQPHRFYHGALIPDGKGGWKRLT